MSKIIVTVNSKGGASKSTVAFQVAAASFLQKNEAITLVELDDANKDSENFVNSKIETKQIEVGDGTNIDSVLRDIFLSNEDENIVLDIGGNQTTFTIIEGLKKSRLFKKIDLFIIPMSGGQQDLVNAKRTHNLIKDFERPIIFGLSRVRNPKRLHFQYKKFFQAFPNEAFFSLKESDVIDLSREQKKSIFEISKDTETKKTLESALDTAFDTNDNNSIAMLGMILQVFDESEEFVKNVLQPAFKLIENKLAQKEKVACDEPV